MSGFFGGDTEQMRGHAEVCAGGAQRLAELIETASTTVHAVQWVGTDADTFRDRWRNEAANRASSTAEILQRLADELERHAQEQDQASEVDGGGLLGRIPGLLPPPGIPFPFFGPMMPLPFPIPGVPIGPGGFGAWFSGNGGSGPQGFYGDPGYSGRGQMYDKVGQYGDAFNYSHDLAPGRELENEFGYADFHAGTNYSVGMNSSTDEYGNMTGSLGAGGSFEAGVDTHLDLPAGFGVDASGNVGIEAYAEGGGTIGPDGFSVGAQAGSGAYGEMSAALTHESGASVGTTQSYWVGADAHANAYSHVTRNADGEVNGFSSGFDAGAFVGAEVKQDFSVTAPNGWFSASGGVSAQAGAGGSASAGYTVSTDEISLSVGGKIAAELGVGGGGTVAINPNAIVESITPGQYNVDDAIDDVQGAWNSATSAAGDALSAINPFD